MINTVTPQIIVADLAQVLFPTDDLVSVGMSAKGKRHQLLA
jgi:hypothetical protein